MKIAFPELDNPIIAEAVARMPEVEAVAANNLAEACVMATDRAVDAVVTGIDYSTADVLKKCRDIIGVKDQTFSSSFVMIRDTEMIVVADAATNKRPNMTRLTDVIVQTYETARRVLPEPRVAVLAYSTLGSGGDDAELVMLRDAVVAARERRPEMVIDGEMQLDAAMNETVAAKKAPDSLVAGRANVLICPDLNTGNVLYKAMEQFGGFVAAGPILQGFNMPVADLSRGSTVEDVMATVQVLINLTEG